MAALVLLRNPLTPHTREQFPLIAGTPVIDWLQQNHPRGFGMPIRFYVNGQEKPLDDLDYKVEDDDVAVIALMPADPVSLATIGIGLLLSAALSVATYFVMRAFMPKEKAGKKDSTSVYDVSSDQNAARPGEPIPVVYGSVLTTPDYVAQPYVWYNWSQAAYNDLYNGVQYLDMVLCVGQGNIDIANVYVGDTDVTTLPAGVVNCVAFKPAQHTSTMGVMAAAMGGYFHENVVTSPEVSNQEFVDTGDSAGYFATAKPGIIGNKFQIDILFPGGQTDPDSDGEIKGRTTNFTVYYQELDDAGTRIGTEYTQVIKASTENSMTVNGPDITNITVTTSAEKNKTAISSPIRRSYMITAPKSARWAVKIVRTTGAPNAKNGSDRFVWAGLKLYADYPAGKVYGNVTLLAIRIKASQGLGSDASVRVQVRANRLLQPPAGGTEAASTSGADAFADVYVNTVYGAARARAELDTATLDTLRTAWTGYQFNYVFRERLTVWEALRTITTPFGAEPLPIGAVMSVAQDGVKALRSALFTDANIIAGTMTVNYSFDEEGAAYGVEIEYLDPKDFRQSYAVYPADALTPDRFKLPGVTNATHATEYARLTWQRSQQQRKRVTFDTELEGLILQLGDRIGISHNIVKWGDGGLVIGASGLTLTVDHDLDWTGGTKQILLRKPDGSVSDPITVTKGSADNKVVMSSDPAVIINFDNAYEYTSFAFGEATTLVRDFVVVSTQPSGENTVTVEAVNYAPDIFTGAMSYMD